MPQHFDPREALLVAATEAVRRPDATQGWTGDTDLYVCYNRLEDRWEVWREDGDGQFRPVMRQREPGQKLDPAAIVRSLVERDTFLRNNSAERQMDRLLKEQEAIASAKEDAMRDSMGEMMERVYHAAASKDLKAETGYVGPISIPAAFKERITALPE